MNAFEAITTGFCALVLGAVLTGVGFFIHLDGKQKAEVDMACVTGGGEPTEVDIKFDGLTDQKVCLYKNDN